ncbi:hypothetical protein SAY86_016439 [Trapa natans]|uniref:Ubiquitin carboxyl-terminal hydrolase-related protein n=1 Tax=Trapa natans TaxID=22666 RepID=A0AAN7L9I1_TRANT|nr:hypothetical protein SAY86_016439 [Trapa natans]
MRRENRKSAHHSKQSPVPAVPPAADGSAHTGAEPGPARPITTEADESAKSYCSCSPCAEDDCDRALTACDRGNYTKALKLMKAACSRHENCPLACLVYRIHCYVCFKFSSTINDVTARHHLKDALGSARRAVELSPNSILLAHFYANMLFKTASETKDFKEVVAECERGLAIKNPTDPAEESLLEVSENEEKTTEERIKKLQYKLRKLNQMSMALASSSMKNSVGDDKSRVVTHDPMVRSSVQSRISGEINKSAKTPERLRKETDVRVVATSLLQLQKPEEVGSPDEDRNKGRDVSGSGPRAPVDRRKHGRNISSPAGRENLVVRSYWNSLSSEKKKAWLSIRVSDLNEHVRFLNENVAIEVISEALDHAEAHKTWSFWVCSKCRKKFSDEKSHMQHILQGHLGNVAPCAESIFSESIDEEWAKLIHDCSWKPVNASAALEMLGNVRTRPLRQKTDDSEDSPGDAKDSSIMKDDSRDSASSHPTSVERNDLDRIGNSDDKDEHEDPFPFAYSPADNWPLCDDPERAKLLEKIHTLLEVLINHDCLLVSHLYMVLQITSKELLGLTSDLQLLSQVVIQSPICICFLGPNKLKEVLMVLQEVSNAFGLDADLQKNINSMLKENIIKQCLEFGEKITLSEDASCIILDETSLPIECTSESTAYDVAGPNSNKCWFDTDAFLSWIYSGLSIYTELESWIKIREKLESLHSETFVMLDLAFFTLQTLCDRKYEFIGYVEALYALEELCNKEIKGKNPGKMLQRSFEAVLRKRMEDLIGNDHYDAFSCSSYELEAINNVLIEVASLRNNLFGDEDAHWNPSFNMNSGENIDGRAPEFMHQMNGFIEVTVQKQEEESLLEICKVDAQIRRTAQIIMILKSEIDTYSMLDYRFILVPLIKSYMRKNLEDLSEKDAAEKSDAAREALFPELSLDSRKVVRDGNDNLKHGSNKKKGRKRHRKQQITNNSKVNGISEQQLHFPKENGPDSLTISSDGNLPDSWIDSSMHTNEFKEQEEELRMIELEDNARKIEEALEFQRKIQNEANQSQVAEQQKKLDQTQSKMTSDGFSDVARSLSADDLNKTQLKPSTQCAQGTGDSYDVLQVGLVLSPTILDIEKGVPNRDFPQVAAIFSVRQTSRRRRGQKGSSKLIEGESQGPSLSGKENAGDWSSGVLSQDNTHQNVDPLLEDFSTKALKELHEDNDSEKFQDEEIEVVQKSPGCPCLLKADLDCLHNENSVVFLFKQDTLYSHVQMSSPACAVQGTTKIAKDTGHRDSDLASTTTDGSDAVGVGLQNIIGNYNCFLNVIIQTLWHLRCFRGEFLKRSTTYHVHVGHPCVICALIEVFHELSLVAADTGNEAVVPTSLRVALSNLYPDSRFFQKGQMNDASEVLGVIFDRLHQSFRRPLGASGYESVEISAEGSLGCEVSNACLVHSLFGMYISERMTCSCGLESRFLEYASFVHNINASALRTTKKLMSTDCSFDYLVDLVKRDAQRACDPDSGGCGKLNHINHFLSSRPQDFTAVLRWAKIEESVEDIAETLATLSTEIDMNVFYCGLDPKQIHSLVSVVCYVGQHYCCFAYDHEIDQWILYDDANVKVIGGWADVLDVCEERHMRPEILFFEAVK